MLSFVILNELVFNVLFSYVYEFQKRDMALRNSNILKNCLRNLNIGTSPECRSVICASRHLSAAVSSEDHKPICRGIKQNIGIQRGFIKYRAVLPEPSSIHVRYYAKSRDKPRKGKIGQISVLKSNLHVCFESISKLQLNT